MTTVTEQQPPRVNGPLQDKVSLARKAVFMLARSGHPVGDGPGLTVNAITPGYVATDMLTSIPEKAMDTFRSKIPVGRSLWSGRRGT